MMAGAPWDFVEKYYTDDLAERGTPEVVWALSWFKEVRGESVLSLGCGPNFYDDITFFPEVPKEAVGIDLNESNIEFLKHSNHPELLRCKNFLDAHQVEVSLIVDDIRKERKEFIGRFDTVYASGVLGMFKKDELSELLRLIHSYLKPGGRLIDVDWTDCQLPQDKYIERESFEWYSTQGPGVEEIGILMTGAGFTILKYDVFTPADPQEYGWGKIYGYVAEK